jgi:CBS domain-containing protein
MMQEKMDKRGEVVMEEESAPKGKSNKTNAPTTPAQKKKKPAVLKLSDAEVARAKAIAVQRLAKHRSLLKQVKTALDQRISTHTFDAHFAEIAAMFLSMRVNNLYVTDAEDRFLGAVSLHDIKPYLGEPELAELVIASDILREDFPRVAPEATLSEALGRFLNFEAERLPVVNDAGQLLGSLSKGDLLLALVEMRKKPTAG